MDSPNEPEPRDDLDEGADALSTSPGPGDLAVLADHGEYEEAPEEYPVKVVGRHRTRGGELPDQ